MIKVKLKQFHYWHGQALRIPGSWGSQISRQLEHEGGKVVSTTHRPPLPQEIFLVLIYVGDWVDPRATVRPEGLCQWKVPMTPSGIEPVTLCVLLSYSVRVLKMQKNIIRISSWWRVGDSCRDLLIVLKMLSLQTQYIISSSFICS